MHVELLDVRAVDNETLRCCQIYWQLLLQVCVQGRDASKCMQVGKRLNPIRINHVGIRRIKCPQEAHLLMLTLTMIWRCTVVRQAIPEISEAILDLINYNLPFGEFTNVNDGTQFLLAVHGEMRAIFILDGVPASVLKGRRTRWREGERTNSGHMQGNGEKQGGQWEVEAWRGGGEASGEGMAREGRLTALVTTKASHAHPMG
mmetsp:Transcript_2703/g.7882  ORF Transcript_2703/g.7882 Transcript_2703/m.7882 type:complete len:203 (-) Transcript_2703:34-642(-)